MQSLQILKDEHEVIIRVLDLLEQTVGLLQHNEPIPRGFRRWVVEFSREFADRCHHGKEEELLFPLLESRGIPRERGPIGCMLNEHVTGRECVDKMEAAIAESPRGNVAFATAALQFVALLREHIFKENNVLFEMVSHCLPAEDDARLVEQYATMTCEHNGGGEKRRFRDELDGWEAEFGEACSAT
jgi:hemerythrin-like domain-containing protein